MAIIFTCPDCDYEVKAPDGTTGKKGTCPRCQNKVTIPEQASSPDSNTQHETETDSAES
ncbi:MAG: hypothetical protein HQ515_26570 [Phycisphaeraceae bacterium]|nr:hypothetical protein [Phycisphaeraceae bacterium]